MQRLVLDINDKNQIVDHIYHDTLDNRKSQLRLCSILQNNKNSRKRKDNKSGITGVTELVDEKRSYWIAFWKEDKKDRSKTFSHTDEGLQKAIAYRKEMVEKHYGEFAYKGESV